MKLPSLDELMFEDDLKEEVELPKAKKQTKKKETKKEENKKKEPIIPKTTYDSEGRPVLAIPDLDDTDLANEINRFFGKEDD